MTYYATPSITLDSVVTQSLLQDASAVTPTATVQTTIDTSDANTILYLKQLIWDVCDYVQKTLYRRFTPYLETKTFYKSYLRKHGYRYDHLLGIRIFVLDNVGGDDCLNISALTWAGTALTSSDYRFMNPNVSPNYELALNPNTSLDTLDDFTDTVSITGTWGYHNNYADMWLDSGDTVGDSPLSASATTITVTSGNNFEVYQLIQIESEYLLITSIAVNVLTVERAKNGTTGASHANGVQIDTFVPMPELAKEIRRLVIRAWFLRDPIANVVVSGERIKELIDNDLSPSIMHLQRKKIGGF